MNLKRAFVISAWSLAILLAALILIWAFSPGQAAADSFYWTAPNYYAATCGGDSVKAIPEYQTRNVVVQLKLAMQPETAYLDYDSTSWAPGVPDSIDLKVPAPGTYTLRVVFRAVNALGGMRHVCPSDEIAWTVVDTCVVGDAPHFGFSRE